MSSRVRELEVNNHGLTARLKELQEQLDAQALQNRCCYPAEVMCVIIVVLQGAHGKEGPRDRLPERATHRLDSGVPGVARDQDRPGYGDRCLQVGPLGSHGQSPHVYNLRTLLEGEENRLGLSQTEEPSYSR